MTELNRLAAEQKRDDTNYQDPQIIGGQRTVPWQKFVDQGRDGNGGDGESSRVAVDHGPTQVGGVGRPRAKWRTDRVAPITRPRTGYERDALTAAVGPFLSDLPLDKLEAIRLVLYGQLSLRQAAAVTGVSHVAVLKRLRTGAELLRPRIEARTGSEGRDFPPTRLLDESDTCRVRPQDDHAHDCDGHFEEAVCDCGTVLPRHYNSHTTCRLHTAGKRTRYQHNIAWLIESGLRALDGQTRSARRRVRGRPSRSGGGGTAAGGAQRAPAPGTANDDRRTA